MAIITPAAAAPAPPPPQIVSAQPHPVYDPIFEPRKQGFLGADGASSVLLAPGRLLWIFGDTIIGKQGKGNRHGPMIHNSVAIHTFEPGKPGTVEFHWGTSGTLPLAPFVPEAKGDPHFFWPGCGVAANGKAYLFLTKLTSSFGLAGPGFHTVGCTLFRVANPADPPAQWRMTQTELTTATDHFNMNSAAMIEGDHVWFLGYDDGPPKHPAARAAILARIPLAALDAPSPGAALEYLAKDGRWVRQPKDLARLFTPGLTETSLHYDAARRRYIAMGIQFGEPDVFMVSAPRPEGPWTKPRKVYAMPEMKPGAKLNAYAAKAHPALSAAPDEMVVTYVVNTADFWAVLSDLSVYYPRFLRVRLADGQADTFTTATESAAGARPPEGKHQ